MIPSFGPIGGLFWPLNFLKLKQIFANVLRFPLGHGICDSFSKIVPLPKATADSAAIASACLSALRRLGPNPCDIRGV